MKRWAERGPLRSRMLASKTCTVLGFSKLAGVEIDCTARSANATSEQVFDGAGHRAEIEPDGSDDKGGGAVGRDGV